MAVLNASGSRSDDRDVGRGTGVVCAGSESPARRPVQPLIRNAAFRTKSNGYNIEAVDWFLGQLLLRPAPAEAAEMSADPWRDLGVVAQVARSGVEDLAERSARPSRRGLRKYYSE